MEKSINPTTRQLIIKFYVMAVFIIFASLPFTANAGSFSYEGYRIRAQPSVGTAAIMRKTTARVRHNQRKKYSQDNMGMTVYVRRKEWWGWSIVSSRSYKGNTSGTFTVTCSKGTYKLFFESNDPLYTYDIWGSFSWQ